MIGIVATSIGRVDNCVNVEHIAFVISQHVAVHGIENIVLPISVVFSMILWAETKAQELLMDFLFCCKTSIDYKWLYQYSTDFAVSVLGKAYHAIRTSIKILVVYFDPFKKRCKVVVSITEIVKLDNFLLVKRQIYFIL